MKRISSYFRWGLVGGCLVFCSCQSSQRQSPGVLGSALVKIGKAVVMPLKGRGVSQDATDALSDLLAVTMSEHSPFEVVTREDLEAQMSREALKDLMGCDAISCAAEIGGALNTRYLLTGTARKLGDELMVTLNLIDTIKQKTKRGNAKAIDEEVGYPAIVETVVEKLLGIEITQQQNSETAGFGGNLNPVKTPRLAKLKVKSIKGGMTAVDTLFLEILQGAKRGDRNKKTPALKKAGLWDEVAEYDGAGDDDIKNQAEQRADAWREIEKAKQDRLKQLQDLETKYKKDSRQLKKLLAFDDDIVSPVQKSAYKNEFHNAYATMERQLCNHGTRLACRAIEERVERRKRLEMEPRLEAARKEAALKQKEKALWISEHRWIVDPKSGCEVYNGKPTPNDSVSYSGGCEKGRASGNGTAQWFVNKKPSGKYVGQWKEGKNHGQGTHTWANGNIYVGGYTDNKMQGQGTKTWADGDKYVGKYKDNKMHGQGTYVWPDGDTYVGEYTNDKMHGQGSYTSASGHKYVGQWNENQQHGQGTYTWANGNAYVGEWVDNQQHGQGTYTWADGNIYVGEWVDNQQHGQGTYTWANGNTYVGEWKEGKQQK
jgi:TolB-like protein